LERQQQQGYQQTFNNSAYAPIPGVNTPRNQNTPLEAGFQSNTEWNELNGRLIGNTYLPPSTSTVDVGKGWYEVHNGGQRIGTLRPGGSNGLFINDTGAQIAPPGMPSIPGFPGGPGGPGGQPGMMPPAQRFNPVGGYGTQAMQMAGLLGQQPAGPAAPPGEPMGLLGGGKRAFRVPGGK
jgi:hypothetical protein